MKKLRWQLLIIFLTGLVIGVLLLTEQQPVQVKQSTPEPVQGGAYIEALIGNTQRLNPLLDASNSVDRDIDRLIYSSLLKFDGRGMPVGDLADTWGVTKDGTIYNVTLRNGLKWQDGQPLTAADVAFTVDLMRTGGDFIPKDVQEFWKDVEVAVLDETNLQFRLPEAFAPFLDYLTFGILPQHILGGQTIDQIVESSFNLQPVGSGPYRFDSWIVENDIIQGVNLASSEVYYGKAPYIQQVTFRFYASSEDAYQAYVNGNVMGIGTVDEAILDKVLAQPDLMIYSGRKPELAMVLFNLGNDQVKFFQDVKIRQALYYGIQRQKMIDQVLKGQAVQADGPILPGTWAAYDGLAHYDYNVEQARQLLKAAGFELPAEGDAVLTKNDQILAFTLLYPDDEQHLKIAQMLQEFWKALNIQVTIEGITYDQLINERLSNRDYQAALVDLNLSRSPDPDPYPFWDTAMAENGQNYTQWDNRIASEYLEQARITVDLSERERLYRNFQILFNQELPALPLFYPVYNYAVENQVQGVRMGPLFDTSDRFSTITEWYLQTQKVNAATLTPTP